MTIHKNLIVDRGHSFSYVVVANRGNKPINLNNYSVLCVAREGFYHDYFKTFFNTKIVDPENGIVRISLDPSDTIGIKVPKLVYTLSIKNNNTGKIEVIMQGHVIMNQTATWDSDWDDFEIIENEEVNDEIPQDTI